MKARPIIFKPDMVRAILDGRKTQTRRAAKLTAGGHVKEPNGNRRWHPDDANAELACPYGQPGDLLWVRETFAWWPAQDTDDELAGVIYRATDDDWECRMFDWSPSIFMPRRYSRLTLQITGVRVERLQEIASTDVLREGVGHLHGYDDSKGPPRDGRQRFAELWESINGPDSWDENPWVWVIDFEPIQANVDDAIAEMSPPKGINYA